MSLTESKSSESLKKLVLVDGNGLAYRAFYALPPLKTSNGEPVNAVYGFTTMLLKILEKEKPDYVAVAFDKSKPTVRLEQFDEYKAHRQKMPEELQQQFLTIEEVVRVFRIPIFFQEGYEADDCIATLAHAGAQQGVYTRIYSGDLDMLQLVTDTAEVVTTRRGISDLVIYNKEMVRKRYGISPPQLVDYKALAGDSSDHIPGIPGIGEASASKLLNQFDDIENMYENPEEIPSRWRKQIIENKEQAFLSKRLVALEKNMPLDYTWEDLSLKEPAREDLRKLFTKLEFKTLLKKMGFDEEELSEIQEINVKIVGKEEDLEQLKASLKSFGSFSIFWIINEEKDLMGLALSSGKTSGYYFPFILPEQLNISSTFGISTFSLDRIIHELKQYLEDPGIKKYVYNLKEGIPYLKRSEYFYGKNFLDIKNGVNMIEVDNPPKTLEYIFSKYTDFNSKTLNEIVMPQKGKKKVKINEIPLQDLTLFTAGRAVRLNSLGPLIEKRLKEESVDDLYYNLELPITMLLSAIEERGIKVDAEVLEEESCKVQSQIDEVSNEIFDMVGHSFNINSSKQLGKVLFEELELPVIKKSGSGFSTSADVMNGLINEHPIISKVLKYRAISKILSNYIDVIKNKIDSNSIKFSPTFNQIGTSVGRITTSHPNFVNIPSGLKRAFIPSTEDLVMISFGFLELELSLLAHFSADEKLIEILKTSDKPYKLMASMVFDVAIDQVTDDLEQRVKKIVESIIRGVNISTLGQSIGASRNEAKLLLEKWFDLFPRVQELIQRTADQARKDGYVETILKRRRKVTGVNSKNRNVRTNWEKVSFHFLIEGSAGDIYKKAMLEIYEKILQGHRDIHLLMFNKGELLFETRKRRLDKYVVQVTDILNSVVALDVPLKVLVKEGYNWLELKSKVLMGSER